MTYERVPFDLSSYIETVRARAKEGSCFVCDIVAGRQTEECVVFRDELCIAFFARPQPLLGYTLLAPLEHRTNVVADFTEDEYAGLQKRVHRVGLAISKTVPTERLYVCSLGSHQGNAHVHWHLAPLPPGVPFERQQFVAMMLEHGHVEVLDDEQARLAADVSAELQH